MIIDYNDEERGSQVKKYLAIAVVLVLMGTLFTGCAGGANNSAGDGTKQEEGQKGSGKKKELTVFHFKVNIDKEFQELLNVYNEQHPDVNVRQEVIGGSTDWRALLKTRFAGGEGPDIFVVEGLSQLETWKNQVVDLSGEPWAEKAFETAKAGAMLDGKLLAMPYNIEGYGLVYNKDIFKQLNIEPPKTLSELREAARTLKEAGYIPFATGFGEWWVIGIHLMNVAFAHQPDQDAFLQGLNDGSAHFADNPVFQQFKDLFDTIIEYGDPNPLTNDYNTQVSLFATGKAAMMQQGNWMEPQVFEINPDMNMGLLPIPINDDAEAMDKLHVGVPFNWVINKDSKNIDEAKQFLNWLVTDETAQSYMTEKFLFIPAYNHIEADNLKGLSQDVMNYSKAGKTLPWVFPKWPEGVDNQFSSAMQGYVGKQNSYEEMLKQIQSSWDELKK